MEVCQYLINSEDHDRLNVYLRSSRISNDLLYKKNKLWVAKDLHLDVIWKVHDQSAARHTEIKKTILTIQQHYFWLKMKKDVDIYIRNCYICQQLKTPRDRYNRTLKPLSMPKRPCIDITMDFVTGLPECELQNAIFMVINYLTKEQMYIPCLDKDNGTNAETTTKMLLHNVWRKHGLPTSIVSDWDPQFVSAMWKTLYKILKINVKLSTAFHFETDSQSKIVNQKMKKHLWAYINHFQNNWVDLLPIAKFAANANPSASTKIPPFQTTHGYIQRISFDPVD